jgi:hypothetical protein
LTPGRFSRAFYFAFAGIAPTVSNITATEALATYLHASPEPRPKEAAMTKHKSGLHWLFSALAAILLFLQTGAAEQRAPAGQSEVAFEDLPLMYD